MSTAANTSTPGGRVLVGTDGSAHAARAVGWAADWASQSGARLDVLAVNGLLAVQRYGGALSAEAEAARVEAQEHVDETVAELGRSHPDLDVVGLVEGGSPAHLLVEGSATAVLTVIGTRGHSPSVSALIGGTADEVVTHARGPIVVVPDGVGAADGPVVVGIDGTSSRAAAEFAFTAAGVLGAPVRAIQAWDRQYMWSGMRVDAVIGDLPGLANEHDAAAQEMLSAVLDPLAAAHPDVETTREVVHLHAVDALSEASETARLVVVGSRGRGGFAGLLLGSVGRKILQYADCPVAVIPE